MKRLDQRRAALSAWVSMLLSGSMLAMAPQVAAELKEMADTEMQAVSGQGMLAFDVSEVGDTVQTRFTMGTKIETQVNFDQVTLGEYDNPAASTTADLDIGHLSLGHIDNTGNGGSSAQKIVPFEADNPYFEIAEKNGELVGFRIGFQEARGTLSGNINSFSGNFGLTVVDDQGTEQQTFLLDENNNSTNNRATQVGVIIVPPPPPQPDPYAEQPATGEAADPVFGPDPQMPTDLEPPPVPDLPPELITQRLSEFKTIDIGEDTGGGSQAKALVNDFFFAFQKEEVTWQSMEGNDPIVAGPGVHFNIPSTMQLTIPQFEAGISRNRTEYIDRNLGLF